MFCSYDLGESAGRRSKNAPEKLPRSARDNDMHGGEYVFECLTEIDALRTDVAEITTIGGAADERDPKLCRKLVGHGRGAVARDQDGDPVVCRLQHHFRGEPAGREQNLVRTADAMQIHEPANG